MKILGDPALVPSSIRSFEMLEEVLTWSLRAGLDIEDVLQQDEYSYDVMLPVTPQLVLVFDTT